MDVHFPNIQINAFVPMHNGAAFASQLSPTFGQFVGGEGEGPGVGEGPGIGEGPGVGPGVGDGPGEGPGDGPGFGVSPPSNVFKAAFKRSFLRSPLNSKRVICTLANLKLTPKHDASQLFLVDKLAFFRDRFHVVVTRHPA